VNLIDGSVGCSADVTAHLDRRCSGRRSCQLTVPDATLHQRRHIGAALGVLDATLHPRRHIGAAPGVSDATLHANDPCPKELMPYLEASYACVRRECRPVICPPAHLPLDTSPDN